MGQVYCPVVIYNSIFTHLQIDLINMRDCPHGSYNWVDCFHYLYSYHSPTHFLAYKDDDHGEFIHLAIIDVAFKITSQISLQFEPFL